MLGKINDYNQLDLIGKGGFGDVYLVESVDKVRYALKLIPVTQQNKDDAKKQAQMYVKLQHPNILKARQYFYYSQERFLAIVLQYCPDGNLANVVGKIDEVEVKNIMKQIVSALAYIHSQKILHRDIKPENILMQNGIPKITDLGLAQIMKTSGMSGKSGTPFYEAPQVLYEQKYGHAADIWSLGILLLQLLLGQRIFKLIKGTLPPGIRDRFPSQTLLQGIKNLQMRQIVRKMLLKKPEERIGINQLMNFFGPQLIHQINKSIIQSTQPILYHFSSQHKQKQIVLEKNDTQAHWEGSWNKNNSQKLILVEGKVFKQGSIIRFKIEGGTDIFGRQPVFLGLGIKKILAEKAYEFYDNPNHGCFMVGCKFFNSKEARSFSHSYEEQNDVKVNFKFEVEDEIRIETNNDELVFVNETQNTEFRMKIKLSEEEWKDACFLAGFFSYKDSVSILQEPRKQMMKVKNPLRFSESEKSDMIVLQKNNTWASSPSKNNNLRTTIAIVQGGLFPKGSMIRFRVETKEQSDRVYMGVIDEKSAREYKYECTREQDYTGQQYEVDHYEYLVCEDCSDPIWGYNEERNFRVSYGDVIQIQTNEKQIIYRNETKDRMIRMQVDFSYKQWNRLRFCVGLSYGAAVSIIQEISWVRQLIQ